VVFLLNEKIKRLRRQNALTQSDLAFRLGVTQQAVAKWEAGLSIPEPAVLLSLSDILRVSVDYLLGKKGIPLQGVLPCGDFSPVPVIGTVKAGYGREAFEDFQGTHPADIRDPQNYFYLIVQGDSMEPYIRAGDLALVRKQNTLQNGELGVMVLDGGEGTLKRFNKNNGQISLESFNPSCKALILHGMYQNRLVILGKVVETKTRW